MKKESISVLMITVRSDYGGGPEHIYRLITNLSENIKIFCASPKNKPYWEKYRKVTGDDSIIEIPFRKFRINFLFKLKKFIKKNKIDIIHSHGKGAGIYSRMLSFLTSKPCIHTFHGIHTDQYNRLIKFAYINIERILSLFTNVFISVSESELNKVKKLKISGRRKIKIICNGVVMPDKRTSEDFFNSSTYNVLIITRFDYAKNTELLIPIIQELTSKNSDKQFCFNITGGGESEDSFKKEIKKEGLEQFVKYLGFADDMENIYLRSFCFLSTSRWEGLSLSVLEAMSYGVPVIATDVAGNIDLVEHNVTGFLYDISNPGEAVRLLLSLSEDKILWEKFSLAGINKVRNNFGIEKMASETEKLYFSIIQ
jgi:glycosyltransferase involved in cell wall biosynthesis